MKTVIMLLFFLSISPLTVAMERTETSYAAFDENKSITTTCMEGALEDPEQPGNRLFQRQSFRTRWGNATTSEKVKTVCVGLAIAGFAGFYAYELIYRCAKNSDDC
jgi:hypothetical protein